MAVVAESREGAPMPLTHFHVFECANKATAIRSGLIALQPVDTTCSSSVAGANVPHLRCRTDNSGAARFTLSKLRDEAASTQLCAAARFAEYDQSSAGTAGVAEDAGVRGSEAIQSDEADVHILATYSRVAALDFSAGAGLFPSLAGLGEGDAGAGSGIDVDAWSDEPHVRCVLAPQPVECSATPDSDMRRGSVVVSLLGETPERGIAPLVRAAEDSEISLRLSPLRGPGAAWLTTSAHCSGQRAFHASVPISKGASSGAEVQLCSEFEGGEHRLTAQYGAIAHSVRVVLAPREVVAWFTPHDEDPDGSGADGGAPGTDPQYAVQLVAPCGGLLSDLALTVHGPEGAKRLTESSPATIDRTPNVGVALESRSVAAGFGCRDVFGPEGVSR